MNPQTVSKPWQPARITVEGTPGANYGEPHALLLAGRHERRTFPMGWNISNTFPVGTEGYARYESDNRHGLWRFATTLPEGRA